jgi:hypothetical protein
MSKLDKSAITLRKSDGTPVGDGLAEMAMAVPLPSDWGPWRLDVGDSPQLVHGLGGGEYCISLGSCTSSAEVLDWISQVAEKKWADNATTGALVAALDDILRPQATLCSGGQPQTTTKAEIDERARAVQAQRVRGFQLYPEAVEAYGRTS